MHLLCGIASYRGQMRTLLLATVLVTTACSKGDDCQQFWDKAGSVMSKLSGKDSAKIAGAKDKFLEGCRKDPKFKNDPMFKCVLGASGESGVNECMTKAFGDYMGKAKKTEAQLQLNKLGKNAKVYFLTDGTFPVGKAGPIPSEPCCKGPDHKCAPVPADQWAASDVWSKLDFEISEPTLFQYSYESDGKTVTATAVGDLDCDGTPVTYTLEMTADADGTPKMNIIEPPAGAH
jgi:hypothetical protein